MALDRGFNVIVFRDECIRPSQVIRRWLCDVRVQRVKMVRFAALADPTQDERFFGKIAETDATGTSRVRQGNRRWIVTLKQSATTT
jgi:hypothetical protein